MNIGYDLCDPPVDETDYEVCPNCEQPYWVEWDAKAWCVDCHAWRCKTCGTVRPRSEKRCEYCAMRLDGDNLRDRLNDPARRGR